MRPDDPLIASATTGAGAEPKALGEIERAILPVIEERASVSARRVVTGRVRVRTVTDTVESTATAELASETVEVTRVPVGRPIDAVPEVRVVGDLTILPVVEEVLVIETRLVLKEEIHVRRRPGRETAEIPVTLRRQRVVVERIDPRTGAVSEDAATLPTSEEPNP